MRMTLIAALKMMEELNDNEILVQDNAGEPQTVENAMEEIRNFADDPDEERDYYVTAEEIREIDEDGYIVTGCEPIYRRIEQEEEAPLSDDAWEKIEALAEQVRTWDYQDVGALRDLVRQTAEALQEYYSKYPFGAGPVKIEELIDMTSLPSAELPEDLADHADYPIWACDESGACLVGAGADEIQTADEIREALDLPPLSQENSVIFRHGKAAITVIARFEGECHEEVRFVHPLTGEECESYAQAMQGWSEQSEDENAEWAALGEEIRKIGENLAEKVMNCEKEEIVLKEA